MSASSSIVTGRGADGRPSPERRSGWRLWLTPSGALLAVICFFLPWGRFSCCGIERRASGAETGGWLWLVFGCAVLAGVAVILGHRLRRLEAGRVAAFGAALLGLLFLVWQAIEFSRGVRTPLGRIRPAQAGIDPAFGLIGTVGGLLVALVGALSLASPARRRVGPK